MCIRDRAITAGGLCGLVPFLDRDTADRLAGQITELDSLEELCGIAPFVSREVLDKLTERLRRKE